MAAYHLVYDSRHLQADCKEPGSAPEPYARQSSMGYLYLYFYGHHMSTMVILGAGVRGEGTVVHSSAPGDFTGQKQVLW